MDQRQRKQQQNQQSVVGEAEVEATTSSNRTEHRAFLLRQHHNRNPRHSPTVQSSSSSLKAHNLSIISLTKLKNYMPQNQVAIQSIQCPSTNESLISKPVFAASSAATDFGCYRGIALNQVDTSSYYYNNEKLARAKSSSSSAHLNNISGTTTQRINPLYESSSGFQQTTSTNQVVAETQQKQQQSSSSDSVTDSQLLASIASEHSRSLKGVEPEAAAEKEEKAASIELQDHQLVTNREERKRKKIDTRDRSKSTNTSRDNNIGSSDHKEVGVQRGGSYTSNNMTPSSLLLLQNHNYIEQHQQHRGIVAQYSDSNHNTQQEQGDDSLVIGQTRTSIANSCSDRGTPSITAKQSDDQHQPQQTHCTNSSLSSSSSSHMLTNINQFKTSDSIGNSSINSANNQTSTSSSANIVEPSEYSVSQGLNQIHNQLLAGDALASSSNINLQQTYHQGLATCDFKATAAGTQFVHYGAQNNRSSNASTYHENFQAAQMLGQQLKLENAVGGRNIFEGNNSIASDDHNVQETGNANNEPLNVVRDLARHQARASINHYYSNHYNPMPHNSSKSASPISSTSTPSPKTNAMHQTTSQHSNQLVLTGQNPSSQIHLDHLNHHYIGNSAAAGSLSQQQHHASQHYSYNQPAASAANQHHLTMPAHDQGYSHQQSHQQQQHQVQPQQSQHLQQQQHHNQHQHSHHQTMANQQSIYHQLANNAANVNVNHIYCNAGNSTHYQGHMQSNASVHQQNHLMSGAHQNHLNTAAAACAAAAVVTQTLKTVANQQNQQHHYGNSISNGFGPSSGSLMNITAQHHPQFHTVNSLNHHHLANQAQVAQHNHQQQQSLPVHHTTSIVSRKYQCKMCPQVFMSKAELKYHNQNHMREAKPYKCLQCPKAFANSSYLSQHMRIHQGVKPYTCDICSRKFTQLSHLQQHKRTHTGDKPYKCSYMNCTKQFSQLSNLQSHSRCHQLDKPYKCNSCYKCFHDEQSLLEHIPRHLESKHLKKNLCIFCGSSYQQERGLVKHFQQYHTDKTPTLVAAAIAAGTTGNTNLIASLVSSTSANAFATPSSGGGSSSSSSSSISSSGSLNVHSNNINMAHGASAAVYGSSRFSPQ